MAGNVWFMDGSFKFLHCRGFRIEIREWKGKLAGGESKEKAWRIGARTIRRRQHAESDERGERSEESKERLITCEEIRER